MSSLKQVSLRVSDDCVTCRQYCPAVADEETGNPLIAVRRRRQHRKIRCQSHNFSLTMPLGRLVGKTIVYQLLIITGDHLNKGERMTSALYISLQESSATNRLSFPAQLFPAVFHAQGLPLYTLCQSLTLK